MSILHTCVDMQEILAIVKCTFISFEAKWKWWYDLTRLYIDRILCISLHNMLDMLNMKLSLFLTLHFEHGYTCICNCTICLRAFGLLHRNKPFLILFILYFIYSRNMKTKHIFFANSETN